MRNKVEVKRLPDSQYAFNDIENATSIEMVGLLYKKMEELVEGCNQFVETVNTENATFINEVAERLTNSATALRQEFQDFIDTIDLEMDHFKSTATEEVIKEAEKEIEKIIGEATADIDIPTKVSELENDAGFITLDDLPEGGNGDSVFVAKYNVTTYEEIHTAFSSGKQVCVEITESTGDDNGCIIAPLTMFLPSYNHVSFGALYKSPTGINNGVYAVLNNGVWSIDYIILNTSV